MHFYVLFIAGWIDYRSIEEITEDKISACVAMHADKEVHGEHLHVIEEILRYVKIDMPISETEDRI